MDQHLVFLLFGLANGAIYAALALTLVVTYRSSGVINFATGGLAALGAYTYAFLRRGELLIPIPGLPKTVDLGSELTFWGAAAISVVITSLFGLVLYLAVFRPLRDVPPVGKAVASIGVMLLLSGLYTVRLGDIGITTEPILPVEPWKIAGANVTSDRVWFAIVILAITIALAASFKFTRFGLLTRAAAESEKGAYVSGIQPDRIAAVNWMISGAVAAVAGILIAPIVPLTPNLFTLLIVPALAAAVIGNFQRLLPAVIAGLAIGMVQSELTYLKGQHDWLPSSGRDEMLVLLLILIVLVVRAKPLPSRGVVVRPALGRAPRPRSILLPTVVGTALGAVGVLTLSGDWLIALISGFIFSVIGLSLVIVTGYAGQISLAQLTLAGVAGFAMGRLIDGGVPFPIAPVLAALIAAAIGVVVGLPALRIRGLPVAVVTLATAVAIEAFWFHNLDFVNVSGQDIDGPTILGIDLSARVGFEYPRKEFAFLCLAVLVIVAVGVAKLRTSRLGSQMLAVRANEKAAAGAGIPVVRVKIIAFAMGAFTAGLGGSMLSYFQANITFITFSVFLGLTVFATTYLAGITSVSGGVLSGVVGAGGLLAIGINEGLGLGGDLYPILSGIGLVTILMTQPEGIVGPFHNWLDARRRAKLADLQAVAVQALEGHLEPQEPVPGGDVVLQTRGVAVRYGGVVAVDGVDLDVREGTIVGLIGPNGAGKTTLLDAMSGFTRSTGTIELHGRDLSSLKPHQRVRAAMGRTFQHTELYEDLSVSENIVVGAAAAQGRDPKTLEETLELLGLSDVAEVPVAELSQGRRQLVSIGRALIGNPRVLLLDEPAGGLDSRESQWLGQRLRTLRDSGVTILLIDHDMHLVLNLCDDIYVLNFGKVIAHGVPAQIRADRTVAEAYLGSTHADQEVVS
ncbi:branched-chain amino acid ABC transporter permease/ATP-binding protein [Nocardioides sp. SR21]|uniref:branched-chain amino acid ABC transporter permease/ATP-binding protein n=1 Tax=Nocardioides sp. SR21 TaxID=2919501 RepID=UPI001FAB3302|nr:branched-chain amino acid ABC transporter permease/ATP-binding protein [Nocardioides sp. SR21]